MFFLELIGETDMTSRTALLDGIRWLFSLLDRPFYDLLSLLYKLFFNVSTWQVFNEALSKFFGRVQLIIGVYMLFQLAIVILKGILDPDSFGKNQNGAKGIVPRVLIALVMILLLLPINTPRSNEFEQQISNQGLLFGTLSSLQYRIIKNNTLERLILGTNGSTDLYSLTDASDEDELDISSRIFASTVLKGFYRINLIDEKERKHEQGKSDDMINDNRVCQNMNDDILNRYTRLDAYPSDIIAMINQTCEPHWDWHNHVLGISAFNGSEKYMFNHQLPIVSTAVGVIFCLILLSFTIDVAVRSLKLGILRLLAPIPILGYMDPGGSRDNAFSAWGKTLVSTYLDLFVRLASVYFVIFLIQDMIVSGIDIEVADGILGRLSVIMVMIGLFMFAKQAPKFIREILGLKSDGGGGFFSGLGMVAGAAVGTAGILGSAATNWSAAHKEGKALYGDAWKQGGLKGLGAHAWSALRTGASTLGGAAGGAYVAGKALAGKDANPAAVMKAQADRNAVRASHSTAPGRFIDSVWGTVSGHSLSEVGNKRKEATSSVSDVAGKLRSMYKEEAINNGRGAAIKSDWLTGAANRDMVGHTFNYSQLRDAYERADVDGNFVATDVAGTSFHLNVADFQPRFFQELEAAQIDDWMTSGTAGTTAGGKTFDEIKNGKARALVTEFESHLSSADGSVGKAHSKAIADGKNEYDALGVAMGEANSYVAETNAGSGRDAMRQTMRNSNARQNQ